MYYTRRDWTPERAIRTTYRGDHSMYLARRDRYAMEPEEFFRSIMEDNELGADLHTARLNDEMMLVFDEHSLYRSEMRARFPAQKAQERLVHLLSTNTDLMDRVKKYPVYFDRTAGKVTAVKKFAANAIVDEETGIVYIVECGIHYIHVVTVMDFGPHSFCGNSRGQITVKPDTVIVTVCLDGMLQLGATEMVRRAPRT